MKKIILLFFVCVFVFSACATKNTLYKNDVTINELSNKVFEVTNNPELINADESWIALNLPINTDICKEYAVILSITGSADIVGLFKTESKEDCDTIFNQSKQYLADLESNWMSEYLPEELPKVKNSACKKMGNYVVFVILDDSARDTVVTSIEDLLQID